MTPGLFTSSMGYLQVMFGHKVDDVALDMYRNALKEMSDEQFKASMAHIVKTFRPTSAAPFPLPVHFLEGAGVDEESHINLAISTLRTAAVKQGSYRSVDFGDLALHAVISRYGGWSTVCRWSDEDWQLNRKGFKETYIAALRHRERGPDHLAGICEAENGTADVVCIATNEVRPAISNKQQQIVGGTQSIGEILKGGV